MNAVDPIRREIRVEAAAATAFALFTDHLGAWWPLARHAVFGDGSVAFEGRRLVERSGDRESVWAEVVEWDPPRSLRLTWHPGSEPDQATDLRVSFSPDGDLHTIVRLEHSGWERQAMPAAAAQEYGQGWPHVLADYGAHVGEQARAADDGDPPR